MVEEMLLYKCKGVFNRSKHIVLQMYYKNSQFWPGGRVWRWCPTCTLFCWGTCQASWDCWWFHSCCGSCAHTQLINKYGVKRVKII